MLSDLFKLNKAASYLQKIEIVTILKSTLSVVQTIFIIFVKIIYNEF